MKKLSLRAKMLLCILPVMAIAMAGLTYVSANQISTTMQEMNTETMNATVIANANIVDGKLKIIKTSCVDIAQMISTSYRFVTMDNYKGTINKIIANNDSVLGSGIWFEPYVFDQNEMYVGPYWYKDGGNIVETYDYSNAEYDYFNQEYYLNAKSLSEGQAMITDPYYDPTTGIVMASCSAPIYDNGTYVGCVTVDMSLADIDGMVSSIKVGKTGTAILLDSKGTYVYCSDSEKVANGVLITNDDNPNLAAMGQDIMTRDSSSPQMGAFMENGNNILLTFVTIPDVNWKLVIRMDIAELEEPVQAAGTKLAIICVIALIAGAVIIYIFVMSISKSINNVKAFAGSLASGDFTVNKIRTKSGDELGQMSDSLNNMFESNRDVISKISNESVQVSETSSGLASMANELSGQFSSI
ncbi:MAG: methyl-accepting chemotaxis protein, partial [Butyrivibrio sp.]|nr:methyl-accepting chemotaxis protein [Butyrivibrio sp.]